MDINTVTGAAIVTTDYWLPDGRIVPVDSTAAKGAALIGFTLKGGLVVTAIRADILMPSRKAAS